MLLPSPSRAALRAARAALVGASCGVLALALPACGKNKKEATTAEASDADKVPGPDPGLCDLIGKRVALFDLNRDGAPDAWKVYTRGEEAETRVEFLSCKQVDFDHDGRKDYVVEFDAKGAKTFERFDFDFDGRFDAAFTFDEQSGMPAKVERDSDFDGRYDLVEAYDERGEIESVERDRNADGNADLWEQYIRGRLVAILYDDDYDEQVDRREEVEYRDDDVWPEDELPGDADADAGDDDDDDDGE
ncbi:hypothetical protein [Haliangium ochraceum]|uniref:Lipoprotein n=1 Tax=Haliangium ochraceum (strain DSM 14365 / JCM 11303 / SMP-2) TaxID=502025 RepID=D0LV82_HALO1|nr:hypothetical protein [Haliangium ochraceum]ACY15923.1 conserved hypothetical protein [Haliangium ochraceum DSM 14365]